MSIVFIGKFKNLHDEEYIARSLEAAGEVVIRVEDTSEAQYIHRTVVHRKPDILLFTKWVCPPEALRPFMRLREEGLKTVCWLFDLYIGYPREWQLEKRNFFKADYVFTTDGGHEEQWKAAGINHHCVRQGIYKEECYMAPYNDPQGIVFLGSENPYYAERTQTLTRLANDYPSFRWLGKTDTNAVRGETLNRLFARTKIVVGDSVPSPRYWSNRVVETLGRGGFLIHADVEGIKEEYPHLVTYPLGNYEELTRLIDYYMEHEEERRAIVEKNYQWVRDNYTMDQKCKELLAYL